MSKVDVVSAAVTPRLRLNLVARVPIDRGDVIFQCSPSEIVEERTWRTIQLDAHRHVKNEFLDYVDHSCDPNAVFDGDRLAMVALRPIASGEPITFFYPGSEVELAKDFVCHCGSPRCVGHLRGAFYLSAEQMRHALESGHCTRFMAEQLTRLLQLPTGV
jgi:hypothetical protein